MALESSLRVIKRQQVVVGMLVWHKHHANGRSKAPGAWLHPADCNWVAALCAQQGKRQHTVVAAELLLLADALWHQTAASMP